MIGRAVFDNVGAIQLIHSASEVPTLSEGATSESASGRSAPRNESIEANAGARYASSAWAVIEADDIWYEVTFDLTESAMTLVEGAGTLDSVLDNVVEMRILSSAQPAWRGDDIAGVLGVDNITFAAVVFVDRFEAGDLSEWSSFVP